MDESSIWDFLVRRLGGAAGSTPGAMPGIEPSVNVGMHPVQNPAMAMTDPVAAPTGPITGPTGPLGPEMLDRETGMPVNDPARSTAGEAPAGKSPWDALMKVGQQVGQMGTGKAPAPVAPAPIHHGQQVSLLDAVFPLNKKKRDEQDY